MIVEIHMYMYMYVHVNVQPFEVIFLLWFDFPLVSYICSMFKALRLKLIKLIKLSVCFLLWLEWCSEEL